MPGHTKRPTLEEFKIYLSKFEENEEKILATFNSNNSDDYAKYVSQKEDQTHETVLHKAIKYGHIKLVKILTQLHHDKKPIALCQTEISSEGKIPLTLAFEAAARANKENLNVKFEIIIELLTYLKSRSQLNILKSLNLKLNNIEITSPISYLLKVKTLSNLINTHACLKLLAQLSELTINEPHFNSSKEPFWLLLIENQSFNFFKSIAEDSRFTSWFKKSMITDTGETILHAAAKKGDLNLIKYVLDKFPESIEKTHQNIPAFKSIIDLLFKNLENHKEVIEIFRLLKEKTKEKDIQKQIFLKICGSEALNKKTQLKGELIEMFGDRTVKKHKKTLPRKEEIKLAPLWEAFETEQKEFFASKEIQNELNRVKDIYSDFIEKNPKHTFTYFYIALFQNPTLKENQVFKEAFEKKFEFVYKLIQIIEKLALEKEDIKKLLDFIKQNEADYPFGNFDERSYRFVLEHLMKKYKDLNDSERSKIIEKAYTYFTKKTGSASIITSKVHVTNIDKSHQGLTRYQENKLKELTEQQSMGGNSSKMDTKETDLNTKKRKRNAKPNQTNKKITFISRRTSNFEKPGTSTLGTPTSSPLINQINSASTPTSLIQKLDQSTQTSPTFASPTQKCDQSTQTSPTEVTSFQAPNQSAQTSSSHTTPSQSRNQSPQTSSSAFFSNISNQISKAHAAASLIASRTHELCNQYEGILMIENRVDKAMDKQGKDISLYKKTFEAKNVNEKLKEIEDLTRQVQQKFKDIYCELLNLNELIHSNKAPFFKANSHEKINKEKALEIFINLPIFNQEERLYQDITNLKQLSKKSASETEVVISISTQIEAFLKQPIFQSSSGTSQNKPKPNQIP